MTPTYARIALTASALVLAGCATAPQSALSLGPSPSPSESPALPGNGQPTAPPSPDLSIEPANYDYRLHYSAFSPSYGPYRVSVRDHRVVSIEGLDANTQQAIAEGWMRPDPRYSLAGLVDQANQAIADPEGDAIVHFDPLTGYPTSVSIDWILLAIDDEEYFSISDIDADIDVVQ